MRINPPKIHDKDIKEETIFISNVEKADMSIEWPYNRDKLITRIEKMVRNCYEYRELISFLKEEMNLDHCILFTNITYDIASIEFHHIFTLFEIVDTVLRKHEVLYGEDNINAFEVANEVMRIHYEGRVLLVPITATVHKLIHSDGLFIPLQVASQSGFGNWRLFLSIYKPYMSDAFMNRFKNYVKESTKVTEDYQLPIVQRRYTYIHVDGFTLPKPIEKKQKKNKG